MNMPSLPPPPPDPKTDPVVDTPSTYPRSPWTRRRLFWVIGLIAAPAVIDLALAPFYQSVWTVEVVLSYLSAPLSFVAGVLIALTLPLHRASLLFWIPVFAVAAWVASLGLQYESCAISRFPINPNQL